MNADLHLLDWVVIALYFGGMAWLGFFFARKNKDTESYFLGGRSFRGWVIGLSLVGTSISSISFLAYPADAYKTAWIRMLPTLLMPIAAIVAVKVFVPLFRSGNRTTAYEYLGLRFGNGIRIYGSLAFILSQFVRLGIVLYLVGKLLETMLGWDIWVCILVAGVLVSAYTIAGGIEAVVWTDVIQTIMLVVGGTAVLVVVIMKIPGGFGEIVQVALADGKLSFAEWVNGTPKPVTWGFSLSEKTGLMMLLLGLTFWLQEFSTDQNVVQRYCASASDSEARKALWWSVVSRLPIWAFFMFLGTALYVFFKINPTPEATAMLNGAEKSEGILPYFVMAFLPVGLSGLIIAAAIAAAMSSLDSSMNAISAVFITDIYRNRIRPSQTEGHYLRAARFVSLGAACVMVLLALLLAFSETKTIQDAAVILSSVLAGGLLGLFMFGIFTRWGDGRAAAIGILGAVVYTILVLLGKKNVIPMPPFDLYYTGLIGNLVMLVACSVASYWFRPSRDLKNLTFWTMDK